jgi:hypothetical protein
MKTIAVEQLDHRLAEALKAQQREEAVMLTENSKPLGLMVRVPEGFSDTTADSVIWLNQPEGRVLVILQAKQHSQEPEGMPGQPVFGSARGMLTIVAEDDEHLKDFDDYMR